MKCAWYVWTLKLPEKIKFFWNWSVTWTFYQFALSKVQFYIWYFFFFFFVQLVGIKTITHVSHVIHFAYRAKTWYLCKNGWSRAFFSDCVVWYACFSGGFHTEVIICGIVYEQQGRQQALWARCLLSVWFSRSLYNAVFIDHCNVFCLFFNLSQLQ